MAKSKAVAKQSAGLPAYMNKYKDEARLDIDKDDILMPRLKLGQAMSDEVKDKKCEEGDFFHNITGEVLCKVGHSLSIIVVAYSKEYIIWYDRKGPSDGIAARARKVMTSEGAKYRWNTPNVLIEDKVEGKIPVKYQLGQYIEDDGLGEWGTQIPDDEASPSAATPHYNYIVVLPDHSNQIIAMSLSKSSGSVAKQFNTMLKMGEYAEYGRIYKMASFEDISDDNRFANYNFSSDWMPVPTEEQFLALQETAKSLADKVVTVDFSDNDDGTSSKSKSGKSGGFDEG